MTTVQVRRQGTTRRCAGVAAGVLMLSAVWTGVAGADPATDPADPSASNAAPAAAPAAAAPAPSPECQAATALLATAQEQLTAALGTLTGATAEQKEAADTAATAATQACATATAAAPGTAPAAAGLAPAAAPAATATGADRDCKDFTSQARGPGVLQQHRWLGGANADRLDANRNGIACEDYPYVNATAPVSTLPAGTFGQVSTVPSGGIETGDGSTGP